MRLKLQELTDEELSESMNENVDVMRGGNEVEPTVSFRDAWKALGKRRQYRSPPQSASTTPTNRNTVDLVEEFRAAVLTRAAEQDGRHHLRTEKISEGETLSTVERPHISTLYFLAEMEKIK